MIEGPRVAEGTGYSESKRRNDALTSGIALGLYVPGGASHNAKLADEVVSLHKLSLCQNSKGPANSSRPNHAVTS